MSIYLITFLIVILLIILITYIVQNFIRNSELNSGEELEEKKFFKIEKFLMTFGTLFIGCAIFAPFFIIMMLELDFNKLEIGVFQDLGPIGDYIGGTTVGLFSLASLLFVAAAMMMQKKELELQRNEVKATRQEYEITNRTMKKQSFDSTFFNMINLHHNILNEIFYEKATGRLAIEKLYNQFESISRSYYFESGVVSFFGENPNNINKFFEVQKNKLSIEIDTAKNDFTPENQYEILKHYQNQILKTDIQDISLVDLINLIDETKGYSRAGYRPLKEIIDKEESAKVNFLHYCDYPNKRFKQILYENFHSINVNKIGHYYRNLYRIVKLIQEYEFSTNIAENETEKKQYRGILRAQLSSYELLLLFYNISYSEKGEKFEKLLINTDFFEEHIVEEKLIWKNDKPELDKFISNK